MNRIEVYEMSENKVESILLSWLNESSFLFDCFSGKNSNQQRDSKYHYLYWYWKYCESHHTYLYNLWTLISNRYITDTLSLPYKSVKRKKDINALPITLQIKNGSQFHLNKIYILNIHDLRGSYLIKG